jgi:hypothetical protein
MMWLAGTNAVLGDKRGQAGTWCMTASASLAVRAVLRINQHRPNTWS